MYSIQTFMRSSLLASVLLLILIGYAPLHGQSPRVGALTPFAHLYRQAGQELAEPRGQALPPTDPRAEERETDGSFPSTCPAAVERIRRNVIRRPAPQVRSQRPRPRSYFPASKNTETTGCSCLLAKPR